MKLASSILVLVSGVVIGITLVLSCGDGSPRPADAADGGTCTCPAAEPPIPSRVMEVKVDETVPANTNHVSHSVACPTIPSQSTVLSGGCTAIITTPEAVILEQSAPVGVGWLCSWSNPTNADIQVTLIVRCLVPAQ